MSSAIHRCASSLIDVIAMSSSRTTMPGPRVPAREVTTPLATRARRRPSAMWGASARTSATSSSLKPVVPSARWRHSTPQQRLFDTSAARSSSPRFIGAITSRYRSLVDRSPAVAWSSDRTGSPADASAVNLLTSSCPYSFSRKRGVAAPSGASAITDVNRIVAGSTVAKNAASIDMTWRRPPSTSACKARTSSPA